MSHEDDSKQVHNPAEGIDQSGSQGATDNLLDEITQEDRPSSESALSSSSAIEELADSSIVANEETEKEIVMDEATEKPKEAVSDVPAETPKKRHPVLGLLLLSLRGLWRITRIAMLVGIIIGTLLGAAYVLKLDNRVQVQFDGKRWALPARVFARPLELYEGQSLRSDDLQEELQLLNYTYVTRTVGTGQYQRDKNTFIIQTRGFKFAEDREIARRIRVVIKKGKIAKLENTESKEPLTLMRLEPVLIGNFYPRHNEDRVLVKIDEVSPLLKKGLVAVEDKHFHDHHGVNPKSIMRALLANIKAGENVQGGSTLTQQLVKNFYLSNERSYKRKANEAIMALLLEYHYGKPEILEAYMNEIYLGQNKKRAIHGFGLASQFYFNRPISELQPEQIALLIGLAKGASFYDPRRHPARALKRRNLVLDIMAREGVLEKIQLAQLKARPLGVTRVSPPSVSPFPAYLDLVRKQLQRDYQEEDLRSEGLLIFTAMDPIVQIRAEQVVKRGVAKLEKSRRMPKNKLNAAMVVSNVQGGEIIALVGGRDARLAGYNRALSASRQIGSLVKPAVYLAALEAKQYNLGSTIDGGPVTVQLSKNKLWKPKNYSGKDHGMVSFETALVHSMNTPTVRIGISLGLDKVINMLHALGLQKEVQPNPSLLLGAVELTPIEVQQMYHTIAAGGTYTQMKSIRSVMNSYGKTLKRYPLRVKQVASPDSIYLLTYAMNKITKVGTAKYLSAVLPAWKNAAGKTGTTNRDVDSWFAGFTGQHVATVWVGRDDNKPTGLTGASGALRLWADLIKNLPTRPFKPKRPKNINYVKVDKHTGLLYNSACGEPVVLPFQKGSEPKEKSACIPQYVEESVQANNGQPVWNNTAPAPATGNGSIWNDDRRVQQQRSSQARSQQQQRQRSSQSRRPVKEVYRSKQEADRAARSINKQWTPPTSVSSPDSDTGEWLDNLIKR